MNYNDYFMFFGKSNNKILKRESFNHSEKIDINGHSFIFYPASLKYPVSFPKLGFHLQFFTWTVMKKLAKRLSTDWTVYINTDDIDLQSKIEDIQADTTMDQSWEELPETIMSYCSTWSNNIIVEPATYVRIIFRLSKFDCQIEIKYGEIILLDDIFFNEKLEYLITFLNAYYEAIREELII